MTTFDTLTIAHNIEAAGLERAQAEAIAKAIRDGQGALATKADLDSVRADLEKQIGALRVEIRIVGALAFAMAAKLFGLFDAATSVLS